MNRNDDTHTQVDKQRIIIEVFNSCVFYLKIYKNNIPSSNIT